MNKGYIASITEYEAGWGWRDDGYAICIDKEVGEVWSTKINNDGSERYFWTPSEFNLCVLTDEGVKAIQQTENGVVWVDDVSPYVEEV